MALNQAGRSSPCSPRVLKSVLGLMAISLVAYILGPPLYWHLMEGLAAVSRSSSVTTCPPCNCDCNSEPFFFIPPGPVSGYGCLKTPFVKFADLLKDPFVNLNPIDCHSLAFCVLMLRILNHNRAKMTQRNWEVFTEVQLFQIFGIIWRKSGSQDFLVIAFGSLSCEWTMVEPWKISLAYLLCLYCGIVISYDLDTMFEQCFFDRYLNVNRPADEILGRASNLNDTLIGSYYVTHENISFDNVTPEDFWTTTFSRVGRLLLDKGSIKATTYNNSMDPKIQTNCAKRDPEVGEDTEKNFADLLSEELKLREAEASENQRKADMALLEAKKLTSQYMKEADKCNSGMETCEEAREKAEVLLLAQKKITATWEMRARQKGWKEGASKSRSQSQGNVQTM
ncbi:hypothetical protein H5410_037994 [Solanum commersonii]|uniref:Uncharacterized protein n=1 Tax=Solanum commersonii TaxID=4109 RepID=A0A9J5Y9G6_SOLCO|nr:hypothetical protein H5410_037994 [Solanum commersonii]